MGKQCQFLLMVKGPANVWILDHGFTQLQTRFIHEISTMATKKDLRRMIISYITYTHEYETMLLNNRINISRKVVALSYN